MKKSIVEVKKSAKAGDILLVEGWVKSKRDSKLVSFIDLNDGSCLSGIQIVIPEELQNQTSDIATGSSISVQGEFVVDGNRKEVLAKKVIIEGNAPNDYPLQKKRHTLEFLREISHLRARTNTIAAVTRVRSRLSFAIHNFFINNGFYYIHTPIISASDAEGAGEMLQVTTLDLKNIPLTKEGEVDYSKDFFHKQTHLTVSGQLHGETYATALKNIYTFGPTFRAEKSSTARHLAEFWMIEPEMCFCDLDCNMQIAESFLKYVINDILENCKEDLEFFDKWIEKGLLDTLNNVVSNEFKRISYTQAVDLIHKSKVKFEFNIKWGDDLQSEHEKYLTDEVFKCPVIVSGYPKEIKAFYMKLNEDGKTVKAMDILFPRLGEIVGGSEREENYKKLLGRINELGLKEEDYNWYLDLRKYGSVRHSGFGLGFERLVLYVTGMKNIRDVIPYPRASKLADF